ncbi:FBD-associated F-box protein At1g66310-like [Lolium rigidum]|uniref:FBD-associated F-box protein At1g66310-like n=1 Tax=Lolium rigidum TaxID=89674 RepID=UPI001F5C5DBD|nr:FBD-associated F-box protein At1g66310-like [Lolium rigidum]
MGNILNQILANTTRHPKQNYQARTADDQFRLSSILFCRATLEHTRCVYNKGVSDSHFELWSVLVSRALSGQARRIYKEATNDYFRLLSLLVCRAISECIRRKLIVYEKGVAIDRFQLWRILICRTMSYFIRHKTIYEKRIADAQFQLLTLSICKAISDYLCCRPICKNEISVDWFVNLPEDVLRTILSKLPLDEVIRTGVLSSKWRCLWTVCPKLCFDGITMFGKNMHNKKIKHSTQKFIDNVNTVLQQCHGRVVEELGVKFEFDTMLVDHLNSWIRFAVSSHAKFLAFDLKPSGLEALSCPQYIFPFQLLDNSSISRLQHIQLCFVSVKPPAQFSGFPNLAKLCLSRVHVSSKDLHHMLSSCCNLEWLSIGQCYQLGGELKVDSPLSHLLYLNIAFSELTRIEFHAVELRTFVYEGPPVPIHLNKSTGLENADIHFIGVTIEDAVSALNSVLINVQNLTMKVHVRPRKLPCVLENSHSFSQLKNLQLKLLFHYDIDSLSLVKFLGATPFIEKLEMHFTSLFGFFYVERKTIRRFEHEQKYLKDVSITGFKASIGQVELLVHIVENTPALDVLTIDQSDIFRKEDAGQEEADDNMDERYGVIRAYIEGKVSPECFVRLI